MTDLAIENERLRQENARLRAENNELRPRLSELGHKLHQKCAGCEYHPHDEPATRRHEHG